MNKSQIEYITFEPKNYKEFHRCIMFVWQLQQELVKFGLHKKILKERMERRRAAYKRLTRKRK